MPEWQPGDEIRITHHAEALWAVTLTDWDQVAALKPFHIYSDATVRDRFDWEGKGMASGSIHVALVRVRKLARAMGVPLRKELWRLPQLGHPPHASGPLAGKRPARSR